MSIEIKRGERDDAFFIRTKVFVEEQGYENEIDEIDDFATHITAYIDGACAGCARVFPKDGEPGRWDIGRVAVLPSFREHGLGRILVEACESAACERGAQLLRLHAQARLEGWYASMGYTRIGEVDYEDEGQPHVWMERSIL